MSAHGIDVRLHPVRSASAKLFVLLPNIRIRHSHRRAVRHTKFGSQTGARSARRPARDRVKCLTLQRINLQECDSTPKTFSISASVSVINPDNTASGLLFHRRDELRQEISRR